MVQYFSVLTVFLIAGPHLGNSQFSNLLEATGVYKEGVKRRPGSATTYRPSFNDVELRDMVAVGLISQELSKKTLQVKTGEIGPGK